MEWISGGAEWSVTFHLPTSSILLEALPLPSFTPPHSHLQSILLMPLVDAAEVRAQSVLPPLPPLLDACTPLTAYSSHIASLYSLSKRASTRTAVLAELAALSVGPDGPLSAVSPLLRHSIARLLQPPTWADEGELHSARQLWAAVKNIVTVRANQCAFMQSEAFRCLLACMPALCSTVHSDTAALLLLGCQLVANTVADNRDTQSAFVHRHLLSSDFLTLVHSCPSTCLSSLLYVIHTVLPSAAGHSLVLDSPSGALLLAEFTVRLSGHQRRHQQHEADEDEDEADVIDSSLLFPSLVHRLFLTHNSLLSLVSDSLQHHHQAECDAAMAFLQSTLVSLSPCSLESDCAADCASGNGLFLLSLLLARYPTEPSERIEDDEGQYVRLPQTLLVDDWVHSCVLLLEHILSSCLPRTPSATRPPPLLQRMMAADVWYVLISLLSSSNTPTVTPSSTATSHSPSVSYRPAVPFGFQSDLLRLLSLLSSCPSSHPPPYPRLTALSFLAHTVIHPDQPMQREYSIVGIRGLCRWEEARQTLASMEAQAVDGREEWRRQGVQLTFDQQSHKVRVASAQRREEDERYSGNGTQWQQQSEHGVDDMWSVERMAAVRSAGRRVDWGDSDNEPFSSDDFM